MDELAISLRNVSKKFYASDCENIFDYLKLKHLRKKKEIIAIDNVSFDIKGGEFVGLLGVNGAGKSTLIKMMTGIMLQTEGKILVLGNDPFKKRIQNNYNIAAVFGQRCQLRWDIAPIESYRLFQAIYKIPNDIFESVLNELVKNLEVESFINQPVRTLSLGQKMRAELVGAFLHQPKIIFLDEPTLGLDVISKEAIIHFLKELRKKRETTVIFTTHDMEDVKSLCERLIIVNKGELIVDDEINNLEKYTRMYTLVKFKGKTENLLIPKELEQFENEIIKDEVCFKASDESQIVFIIDKMFRSNVIYEIDIVKPEFKDIFKNIFSEEGVIHENL